MKPYIVEFIGLAGVGKSTYTQTLFNSLEKLNIKAELIHGNSIYGDKARFSQPFKFMHSFLKRPLFGLQLLFHFIKNYNFKGISSFLKFSLWYFRIMIYAESIHRKQKQGFSVLCIDKGIFTRMVKLAPRIDLLPVFNLLLKHHLLTNTLVELSANHKLINRRRKSRDNERFVEVEKTETLNVRKTLFNAKYIKQLDYYKLDIQSNQSIEQNVLSLITHISQKIEIGFIYKNV